MEKRNCRFGVAAGPKQVRYSTPTNLGGAVIIFPYRISKVTSAMTNRPNINSSLHLTMCITSRTVK